MKQIVILVITTALFLSSCDEEKTMTEPSNKELILTSIPSGSNFDVFDIINEIDNNNIYGVVSFFYEKRNDRLSVFENGNWNYNSYDGIDQSIQAGMWDALGNPLSVREFIINGLTLREHEAGAYYVFSDGPTNVNYNGNSNYVGISYNGSTTEFRDSISFSNPVSITSHQRDDSVSVSDTLMLTWQGGNNKYEINISATSDHDSTLTPGDVNGFKFYSNNGTSSLVIYPQILSRLSYLGKYDIKISSYDYGYRTQPNGKDLLLLGINSHAITVDLY